MLRVEVFINRKRVAVADALNVKGKVVSDYACSATTGENPFTGAGLRLDGFEIKRHRRAQSVWTLVAKMALRLARSDRARTAYEAERAIRKEASDAQS